MKTKYLIIGAGIGGLAAAAELKSKGVENFLVVDKSPSLPMNLSNGVHYLHSNDFGTPFPFELKKISSTEEIWDPRTDVFKKTANVSEMIDYSMKVMGIRHPSSIMDPGSRDWETYIPLSNDMNDLLRSYYEYIGAEHLLWERELGSLQISGHIAHFFGGQSSIEYEHLISTAPLNKFMNVCSIHCVSDFKCQPVYVANYTTNNIVANWLISLYIADKQFPPYRITILNNTMSMESIKEMTESDEHIVWYHLSRYFDYDVERGKKYCWETGRIFGLSKPERESIISSFKKNDIHLLGRFARWNGKMLMDTTILQAREIINNIV